MTGREELIFDPQVKELVDRLFHLLERTDLTVAVAESCTGGLLGGALTAQPGSSACFRGGVIAYSNRVKVNLLGVEKSVLRERGAVSNKICAQMAAGVSEKIRSDVSLAVTGIAGPGGGSPDKPVGLVYTGSRVKSDVRVIENNFSGSRSEIRLQSVEKCISQLIEDLK